MRETRKVINPTIPNQKGAGLIEILISVLILSVGLLGVASLQFVGAFNNTQSITRTQAELVARQIVEQLKAAAISDSESDGLVADDQYFDDTNYNFSELSCNSSQPYSCYCLSIPEAVPDCRENQCTAAQIAEFDGWASSCAAVQVNPNMTIHVTCNDNLTTDTSSCSAGSPIEVKLAWPIATKSQDAESVNSDCAVSEESRACVIKDVTL